MQEFFSFEFGHEYKLACKIFLWFILVHCVQVKNKFQSLSIKTYSTIFQQFISPKDQIQSEIPHHKMKGSIGQSLAVALLR